MSGRRKRVGVVAILQESNTFAPGVTTWDDFQEGIFLRGEEVSRECLGGNHEVSGFFSGLEKEQIQAVPILYAFAIPGPPVSRESLKRIWELVGGELASVGPLDGCLVAAGGAAVSEKHRDMDGWWMEQLRHRLGEKTPIIGTLDPHAHISKQMLEATNALLPYHTNPHLDQKERGEKAARLMASTLRGEIRPQQKFCRLPLIINIEKQSTVSGPLVSIVEACAREEEKPGVLDASLVLGFPYGDVPEMGTGVLVTTDDDAEQAGQSALKLAHSLWKIREELRGDFIDPPEAVQLAASAESPVLLLDMGDNIGGGAVGDGTWLLHLLNESPGRRSFFCLYDPVAARSCRQAGLGAKVALKLGGWSDPRQQGAPVNFAGQVEFLPPPSFQEENPRHGGWRDFSLGESVVLGRRGHHLKILVTSQRVAPFSAGMVRAAGLRVEDLDLVVAKGVHGPLGAFGPLCRSVIRVNTPGITGADLTAFSYKNRLHPMEPFEPVSHHAPGTVL